MYVDDIYWRRLPLRLPVRTTSMTLVTPSQAHNLPNRAWLLFQVVPLLFRCSVTVPLSKSQKEEIMGLVSSFPPSLSCMWFTSMLALDSPPSLAAVTQVTQPFLGLALRLEKNHLTPL